MHAKLTNSHRLQSKAVLIGAALVVLTALTASVRAWLAPGPGDGSPILATQPEPEPHSLAQRNSDKERVEAEVITILPTGFNPSEITRPHGRFLILIDNRSGSEEITLRLDQRAGHRLRELRRTKEEPIARQIEDLPPGEYLLTEANNPEWVCRITIKPR